MMVSEVLIGWVHEAIGVYNGGIVP